MCNQCINGRIRLIIFLGGIGECLQAHECGLEGGKPDGLCHLVCKGGGGGG